MTRRALTNEEERKAIFARLQRTLHNVAIDLRADTDALDELVGRAQNGPPQGQGDNTIPVPEWIKARDLVPHLRLILAFAGASAGITGDE